MAAASIALKVSKKSNHVDEDVKIRPLVQSTLKSLTWKNECICSQARFSFTQAPTPLQICLIANDFVICLHHLFLMNTERKRILLS